MKKQAEQNVKCAQCGQFDIGQSGEYPCETCGLPTVWDDVPERMTGDAFAMMQEQSPAVDHATLPDAITDDDPRQFLGWSDVNKAYRAGWNQYREALLKEDSLIIRRCCPHDSDCAVHNAPALPIGPCDCSLDARVPEMFPGTAAQLSSLSASPTPGESHE